MKNTYGYEMTPNPYHMNPTMRLLGYQYAADPFWRNEEALKQIGEISQARKFSFAIEAAADIFMLGYIHGKRAERAKRKRGVSNAPV